MLTREFVDSMQPPPAAGVAAHGMSGGGVQKPPKQNTLQQSAPVVQAIPEGVQSPPRRLACVPDTGIAAAIGVADTGLAIGGAGGHASHRAGVARAAAAVGVGGAAAPLGLAGVLAEVTATGLLVAVHRAALGRTAAGAALTRRSTARRQIHLTATIVAADVGATVGVRLAVFAFDQAQLPAAQAVVAGQRAAVERLLAADAIGDAVVRAHHLLAAELGLALAGAARRRVVARGAGGLARPGLETEATVAAPRAARDVLGAHDAELEAHAIVGAAQPERVADPAAAVATRRAHRAGRSTGPTAARVTRAGGVGRAASRGAHRVDAARARGALGTSWRVGVRAREGDRGRGDEERRARESEHGGPLPAPGARSRRSVTAVTPPAEAAMPGARWARWATSAPRRVHPTACGRSTR